MPRVAAELEADQVLLLRPQRVVGDLSAGFLPGFVCRERLASSPAMALVDVAS
jgi:hypothetical protein